MFAINSISPFVLASKLKPIMIRARARGGVGEDVDGADDGSQGHGHGRGDSKSSVDADTHAAATATAAVQFQEGDNVQVAQVAQCPFSTLPAPVSMAEAILRKTRDKDAAAFRGGSNYRGSGPLQPGTMEDPTYAVSSSKSSKSSSSSASASAHGSVSPRVSGSESSFIVNVSSMEAKFYRRKMATHPHTNMAKSAMNSK